MVMPIWAVERNLSGSFIKSSAMRAERLPALASLCRRVRRAEINATSDREKKPLKATSIKMIIMSNIYI